VLSERPWRKHFPNRSSGLPTLISDYPVSDLELAFN